MGNKNKILIGILVVILIILVIDSIVLFGSNTKKIIPLKQPIDNEKCKTLFFSDKNAINLLFFGDEVQIQPYVNELFSINPFRKNKDSFNVFFTPQEINCSIYEETAILCHSLDLFRKASVCPNDYIIVLSDLSPSLRSSSYMQVVSINTYSKLRVLPHEFAHAFANLADEYVPADLPRGQKNCVENCSSFQGINEGCFEGCSQESYYRSIDRGLMSTLDSDNYGLFNERIIQERINKSKRNSLLTGFSIEGYSCNIENYYLIIANYKNEKIEIQRIQLEVGCAREFSNGGDFYYSVKDDSDNIVINGEFEPSLVFTDGEENRNLVGGTQEYEGSFFIRVPYQEGLEKITIGKNNGGELASAQFNQADNYPCRIN
jgi:hypothetical protein